MTMLLYRFTVALLFCALASPVAAAPSGVGLVDESHARQFGLERAWFAQVHIDPGKDKLAGVTQHTSFDPSVSYTLFEVTTDEGATYSYSERDRGAFGRPLGVEGAKQLAQTRLELLNAEKKNAKVSERVIPQTILLVSSRRGALHVLDGESGRTLWSRNVGRVDHPSTAAAANDKFVAMINGVTLFVFHRSDGRLAFERKVRGAPTAGPALSTEYVFVPMAGGKVEGYRLDNPRQPPWAYKAAGHIFMQPITTARSVAWATDRGHVYVSRPDNPAVRFRLETRGSIVTKPTYRYPLIYAASQDGYVYAMHETAGGTVWRFSAGMPIQVDPAAVGNAVFVAPERGGMYRLNADTGEAVWMARGANRFVAASGSRVYALDAYNRLTVLDAETGGVIGQLRTDTLNVHVANQHTDRIYLANSTGLIQCLREVDNRRPIVHVTAVPAEEVVKPAAPAAEATDGEAGDEMPADEAVPADEMPMEEAAPADEMPMEEAAPADEMPMEEGPVEEAAPAEETAPE